MNGTQDWTVIFMVATYVGVWVILSLKPRRNQ